MPGHPSYGQNTRKAWSQVSWALSTPAPPLSDSGSLLPLLHSSPSDASGVCYLWLCNTLPQNLARQQQTFITPHTGSGTQGGSSREALVRLQAGRWLGLPLTKGLSGAGGSAPGVASHTASTSVVGRQEASGLLRVGSSSRLHGCPHNTAAGFPPERTSQESKGLAEAHPFVTFSQKSPSIPLATFCSLQASH